MVRFLLTAAIFCALGAAVLGFANRVKLLRLNQELLRLNQELNAAQSARDDAHNKLNDLQQRLKQTEDRLSTQERLTQQERDSRNGELNAANGNYHVGNDQDHTHNPHYRRRARPTPSSLLEPQIRSDIVCLHAQSAATRQALASRTGGSP